MKAPPGRPLLGAERLGWHLVAHPAFRTPLLNLAAEVAGLRKRDPTDWSFSPKAKLLKRILELILEEIPRNPGSPAFEQGNTLGMDARGWRRAKFLGRFRLFFRFDTGAKVIVYAWVNDENSLRKAGAASDPYAMFRAMLVAGDPPHGWDALLQACETPAGDDALAQLLGPLRPVPATERKPRRK